MKDKDNEKLRIEKEVSETLNSLDDLDDIEPSPYFYARLQAKLGKTVEPSGSWIDALLLISKPVPSLLAVVLLFNIFTAYVMYSGNDDDQSITRTDYVEAVAQEYLLTETSVALTIVSE